MADKNKYKKTLRGVLSVLYGAMIYRNRTRFKCNLDFEKEEFLDMFLQDPTYQCLHKGWEDSGYIKNKKPSIDRINPDFPYMKNNIQFMTYEENINKGRVESKRITTAVLVYDMFGKIVNEFESISQASEETGIGRVLISACCVGKIRRAGIYVFKYRGDKNRRRFKVCNETNMKNFLPSNNKTGHLGIYFERNKYRVRITKNRKKIEGGMHSTLKEAIDTRNRLMQKHKTPISKGA